MLDQCCSVDKQNQKPIFAVREEKLNMARDNSAIIFVLWYEAMLVIRRRRLITSMKACSS